MPHLSPMNWILAFMTTTILLISIMSTLWWNPQPSFKHKKNKTIKNQPWSWL